MTQENNETLPKSKKILITGTASFKGFRLAKKLLERYDNAVSFCERIAA
ncbi:MAG: hypothetical protein IBX44_02675 [Sulfurospirillum sp.]|nr:hypothetical protein [Sulfurospirillum sp.]